MMPRRRFLASMSAMLLGPAVLPRRASGLLPTFTDDRFVERWSWAMGQPVHLMLFADSEARGFDAAQAALAELRRVESKLSLFDSASDLCELNRRAGGDGMRVDRDLRTVLERALDLERRTGGCFNIAVEPLMRVWGFHRPRRAEPSPREVRAARDAVRGARLAVDGARARLFGSHAALDLGGIGVGYGLDQAAIVLRAHGVRRALLDVSGDCIALGAPPGKDAWKVELAHPTPSSAPRRSVLLRDRALATSANTESVVRYGADIFGHVMNPETGLPADDRTQVTVVAHSGVDADALSTAMLVGGRAFDGVEQAFVERVGRRE
jgi:thiamine biosynthesis lipoprotein